MITWLSSLILRSQISVTLVTQLVPLCSYSTQKIAPVARALRTARLVAKCRWPPSEASTRFFQHMSIYLPSSSCFVSTSEHDIYVNCITERLTLLLDQSDFLVPPQLASVVFKHSWCILLAANASCTPLTSISFIPSVALTCCTIDVVKSPPLNILHLRYTRW